MISMTLKQSRKLSIGNAGSNKGNSWPLATQLAVLLYLRRIFITSVEALSGISPRTRVLQSTFIENQIQT